MTQTYSAVALAKRMMFIDTAEGAYIDTIGQNVGVQRYRLISSDDTLYANLVQLLGYLPKSGKFGIYTLLGIIFGTQGELIAQGSRPWRVYCVNANEIVVEIPLALLTSSNETSSYMHGWAGTVWSNTATTTVFECVGDANAAATSLVGLDCSVLIGTTFETQAISTAVYDASTNLTTITVSSAYASPPVAGTRFFIDVPGDDASSYAGDYLAEDATREADGTNAPHDVRVYLTGEGMVEVFRYYYNLFCRAAGVELRVEYV